MKVKNLNFLNPLTVTDTIELKEEFVDPKKKKTTK